MMPDHLHGILFVREALERPLGKVLLGFKQGCNKAFRELHLAPSSVCCCTTATNKTPATPSRYHGLLFAPGYNDKLLLRQGQLQRWLDYLKDNPRSW